MKANLKIVAGVGAAMLFAGSAGAAVLTAPTVNYSKEGFSAAVPATTLPVITAVLAADYSIEDRISVTLSGANIVAGTDLTASMTCPDDPLTPANEGNGIIVGFLNRSGNTLNFRVTQVDVANNLGATCQIGGIQVSTSSIGASTSVTATYAARSLAGEVIDTGCATAGSPGTLFLCSSTTPATVPNLVTLATVGSQFAAGVPTPGGLKFNAVIDVEADRLKFVSTDETAPNLNTQDSMNVVVTNKGQLAGAVAVTSAVMTLTGDFSFLAGKDGICGNADDKGQVVSQALGVLPLTARASNCSKVSWTYPGASFPALLTTNLPDTIGIFLPTGVDAVKLTPRVFAANVTFKYGTDSTVPFDFAAGEWTINGALVFVPYMPYGDDISQIIYIANRGTQNADISIDAFDENGATYSFDVGQVAGGTVRKLTGEILTGLTNAGFVAPGKVGFELTVNAPDSDIDVYSAYNVGGSDRGTVVNSQNGKALQ